MDALAGQVGERVARGEPGVISCADLERNYCQITIGIRKGLTLVYLQGHEELFTRGAGRRNHRYRAASPVQGQFGPVEERTNDEHAIVISAAGTLAETPLEFLNNVAAPHVRQGTAGASAAMSSADATGAT